MSLPSNSTWHILKGTWFVYQEGQKMIHIQLKNSGMQYVYLNEELVSEKRSLKLRTEQKFEAKGDQYLIRTNPSNKAMTSFSTELLINGELVRTFTFTYRTDFKRYLPFILVIIALTVPLAILKMPTYTYYLMVGIVVLLKLLVFNKDMFFIRESDNEITLDI